MDVSLTSERAPLLRRRLCALIDAEEPWRRDGTTALLRLLLKPGGAFARRTECRPLTATDASGAPLACCVLMHAQAMADTVMLAFLESLPRQQAAVARLVREAEVFARSRGAHRLLMGVDGHVNNGMGLPRSPAVEPPVFGSSCQPPHVADLLEEHAHRRHDLLSFTCPVDTFHLGSSNLHERLRRTFHVRQGHFRRLREELLLYTQLNNRCFASHPFYYARAPEEDYELFRSFRPLLREENFLVVEQAGRPVGFLLWYPDFHQLVPPGGRVGAATVWRYRALHRCPSRFKLAEFGVLPECRGVGAVLALVQACYERVRDRFDVCESGWIHQDNLRSLAITERWASGESHRYSAFERDLAP